MCPFANLRVGCGAATIARPDTVEDDAGIDARLQRPAYRKDNASMGAKSTEAHDPA
jgi:hypothetical protein